jgi:hypothetical protein
MDPLELLRTKIAGFPGYADEAARRHSDEYVRSYLGEALADLEVRCTDISPELKQSIGALLLRVGFADQKAFAIHHVNAGTHAVPSADSIALVDAATVDVACQAPLVAPDDLARYLDEVAATLDRRDAAMRGAAAANA